MKRSTRLVGPIATVLSAVLAVGCTGSAGNGTAGTAGNGAGGTVGSGAGGSAGGATAGTTGRGGAGGTATGGSATGGTSAGGSNGGSAVGGSGSGATGGSGGGATAGGGGAGTGGARGGTGGSGGATAGSGGAGTGGARGGTGGSGGSGGATAGSGGAGTGGSTSSGTCSDGMKNGSETGVDCGGSCGACAGYMISPPNTGDTVGSGCNGGPAFMCVRDMVYSPELKAAEADDFGSPENPQFVYGVVGHDKDSGGLDTEGGSNACCQCYQLVFTTPRDPVSGVPTPKPMIVQAFNTGAGGGKNFDIFMGSGGEGANTAGCMRQYTAYPTIGQPNNGGIRYQSVSQCAGSMGAYSAMSIGTTACQSAIAADCAMITGNAAVQSTTQVSCTETNQPQNLYHMNWNVMAKRIECPASLTRVTGCKLNGQGLPAADPTAVDMNSASSKGFMSGYTTTTMQDCCRPTCAYKGNVTGADGTYKQYYTCDSSGNPS